MTTSVILLRFNLDFVQNFEILYFVLFHIMNYEINNISSGVKRVFIDIHVQEKKSIKLKIS